MDMMRLHVPVALVVLGCSSAGFLSAQSAGGNAGTVRGTVLDPSGAAIVGAAVEIQNPVSHYNQTTKTDNQGNFEFDNIPYNNYHVTAKASGFQAGAEDVDVRSALPLEVKINLKIGAATQTVEVTAEARICSKPTRLRTPTWIGRCSTSCRWKASPRRSVRW